MICVIEIIEGPARGKRIWIKENQCIEVGRVSSADFPIPSDLHMSRRHLLFESNQNGFRIRDLGSANGTFLNNARIIVENLATGDTVRAGMTAFNISIRDGDENPHSQDGLTFNQSLPIKHTLPREDSGTIRSLEGLEPIEFDKTLRIPIRSAENQASSSEIKELEPSLAPQPNSQIAEWWKSYFASTTVSSLYEQTSLYSSPLGNLMGLLQQFESEFELSIVVNESQMDSKGRELLSSLRTAGQIEALSKSLCRVKFGRSRDIQKILALYIGQDAIICIGEKKRISQEEWGVFANSLSYPSMLRSHLAGSASSLRKSLLRSNIMLLYEMDSEGNLGLLIGE